MSVHKTDLNNRPTENVMDYPRPPRIERSDRRIRVEFNGATIADTTGAVRVLETTHPPTYYIPPDDVAMEYFRPSSQLTVCEWKGTASYYDVAVGERTASDAAWYYSNPTPPFAEIKDYVAIYPGKMDRCTVDGETVQAQASGFYGGWITGEIVGWEQR